LSEILVIDLEATCWEGGKTPAGRFNEIIEIGMAVVRHDPDWDPDSFFYASLGEGSLFVRPEVSEISPFCTELTGITPEVVQGGLSFADAMAILREHKEKPWASWGQWDYKHLKRECQRHEIGFPLNFLHLNLKNWWSVMNGRKGMWIGDAVKIEGQQFLGTPHRGADDALTAAMMLTRMLKRYHS